MNVPKGLWVPGQSLDAEYPVPSPEELRDAWAEYTSTGTHKVEGVFGTYRPVAEHELVTAMVAVDLCEVVRNTALAHDLVADGPGIGPRSEYHSRTWFADCDPIYIRGVIVPVVQTVMNADLVEPVAGHTEIGDLMQGWRKAGVYVAANTSTLPGCELATIRFLKRFYPGCFDALLLPRNYDGKGPISKARALEILGQNVGVDPQQLPTAVIDDAVHHILGFEELFGGQNVSHVSVLPAHQSNKGRFPPEHYTQSPLEAFERVDAYLRDQRTATERGSA